MAVATEDDLLNGGNVSARRMAISLIALAVLVGQVVLGTPLSTMATAAVVPVVRDGSAQDRAAASCWEVHQVAPTAPSGTYWLQTPALVTPARFRCDMTTDGGGWVLVGRGREGWQTSYGGVGSANALNADRTNFDTVQLPSTTIDGLLDKSAVKNLSDGVRVRRALNSTGSQWQEVRLSPSRMGRWSWTLGAGHPLSNWTVGASTGTDGNSRAFGSGTGTDVVDTALSSSQGWTQGFAYGSSLAGSSSATSYLWSATTGQGGARPYAEVWIRPRLTQSSLSYAAVPDAGTTATTMTDVVSSDALPQSWGVTGTGVATSEEGDLQVQVLTEVGANVYVGGNFRYVQDGASPTQQVDQPFLAAFNRDTGAWVPGFRPQLNGSVRALAALPDGRLAVGGKFSQANGVAVTSLVMLDPATGATSGIQDRLVNNVTAGVLQVEALSVASGYLYVGGAFSHVTGGQIGYWAYSRNATRIDLASTTPDVGWNPEFNGTVLSVDAPAGANRVYASGFFSNVHVNQAAFRAAALTRDAGAPLATPAWSPTWSNSNNNYQRAVLGVGDQVWVGGSEHSVFAFSSSTFSRTNSHIFESKGDAQSLASDGKVVYAGCHCNEFNLEGATKWPDNMIAPLNSTWSTADKISWVGGFDARTGSTIPSFNPVISSSGGGVWASLVDSKGTLWAGGDLTSARTASGSTWLGGFARFAAADVTPPARPTGLTAVAPSDSNLNLTWSGSAGTGVSYEVLRDDRVIATTDATATTVQRGGSDRYAVRAVDAAGNRSASTVVYSPATQPATSTVVAANSIWRWYYQLSAPSAGWAGSAFDASGWPQGAGPLGWGSSDIATNTDTSGGQKTLRSPTMYFRRDFTVADSSKVMGLQINTIADDGVLVRVNGVEVGRKRLDAGAVDHGTYANAVVSRSQALAEPVVIDVPTSLLVNGTNTIGVETHLNYRMTPDVSFDLTARMTTTGP